MFASASESSAQPTRLVSETELLHAIALTSFDIRRAVKSVLATVPVDSQGRYKKRVSLSKLTVGQLFEGYSRLAHEPVAAGRPRFHDCWFWVVNEMALQVIPVLVHVGRIPLGYPIDVAQLHELYTAAHTHLKPYLNAPVLSFLKNEPQANGFIHGLAAEDLATLEKLVTRHAASCGGTKKNILGTAMTHAGQDYEVKAWRLALPVHADAGEKLYDVQVLCVDASGRAAVSLDLRLVYLSEDAYTNDVVGVLDAYDEAGLELGVALARRFGDDPEGALDFFDGGGFVQLQYLQVRQDLRGQGLGMAVLRRVMAVLTKGLRKRPLSHMVVAVEPMQFDFPLMGLPAELLLDGLDAVERVTSYFERTRPQDAHSDLFGVQLTFVATDPLARGSHLEQLRLLGEQR